MAEFYADVRDIKFVLFEQAGLEELRRFERYSEFDRDTLETILDEAYRFAKNQLAPMNAPADKEGCGFDPQTGSVKVPAAFRESRALFAENGWLSLSNSVDYGGQGMPYAMRMAADDMFFGACLSFCLEPLLSAGTGHLVEVFGSDELKKIYLEKIYTGEWAGTMCLTEAAAGTDVGALRTKAKKVGDHYLIEGEKIFITYGDHDLTENICHAVLARIEGAPAGTAGISLFLVPKVRVNPDGSLGEPNDVQCTGLEHKLGIHGSPTCTMTFGAEGKCHGYLLGDENKGMRAMFQMMNEARIGVGQQGAALGNAAYQLALSYAKERIQGKELLKMKDPAAPAVAIVEHPDVRRMLMWQKAYAEGCRALLLRTAVFADIHMVSPDEAERQKYAGLVEVLTPICKAYGSDMGFRVAELAVQTMGGYGYIKEYPVEQHLRDVKITSIYEGTNGIQALDLVGRKLPARGGADLMTLVGTVNELISANEQHPLLAGEFALLAKARDALAGVSMHFAAIGSKDPLVPVLNASPYLALFGQVVLGWLLLEQAAIAYPKLEAICKDKGIALDDGKSLRKLCEDDEEARYYDGKLKVAKFYAHQALTQCGAMAKAIQSGDKSALAVTL